MKTRVSVSASASCQEVRPIKLSPPAAHMNLLNAIVSVDPEAAGRMTGVEAAN